MEAPATDPAPAGVAQKLKHLVKSLLGVALVIAVFFGYVRWVEGSARRAAESFCASATVGSLAESLPERAIELGAERRYARWTDAVNGRSQMLAMFTGVPPFSRYICTVDAEHGRVVASNVGHLD
jgi:hypothetical protein